MKRKNKLYLKKITLHPITTFIVLILFVMVLSSLLSLFQVQTNYSRINSSNELENVTVTVESLFNFNGFKYIISEAARNFVSFTPLSTLIIALVGISVAHASGFIDTAIKRGTLKINNKLITFMIIFIATISSIINEVGYVVLIPLSALVFLANGRNPLLGITASFCGVAFGYGVTLFAGSAEINLVSYTEKAARLIDSSYHVSLLSNLFAIIISSIVISIVGTYVVEKVLSKRIGKYHLNAEEDEIGSETKEIMLEDVEVAQQRKLEEEVREKKGLKNALIASIVFLLIFIYVLIPGLPGSGLLLDMSESAYINQLFGDNSYFQDGFTFLISIWFLVVGVAYAKGAKTISSDKELVEKASIYLKDVGYLCALIFFAAQFIAIFKKSNIGMVALGFISSIIRSLPFSGIPLMVTVLILIALSGLFVTTQVSKWAVFAPVVVPILMQNNIAPQFAQFIFRAGDSMLKGFSPFLAYFVIYLGYLNVYNTSDKPIGIKKALSFVAPYCGIISITWIIIVVLMYIIGIPIGPNVMPVL